MVWEKKNCCCCCCSRKDSSPTLITHVNTPILVLVLAFWLYHSILVKPWLSWFMFCLNGICFVFLKIFQKTLNAHFLGLKSMHLLYCTIGISCCRTFIYIYITYLENTTARTQTSEFNTAYSLSVLRRSLPRSMNRPEQAGIFSAEHGGEVMRFVGKRKTPVETTGLTRVGECYLWCCTSLFVDIPFFLHLAIDLCGRNLRAWAMGWFISLLGKIFGSPESSMDEERHTGTFGSFFQDDKAKSKAWGCIKRNP